MLKGTLRRTLKRVFSPAVSIAAQRRVTDRFALLMPAPAGVRRKTIELGGVSTDFVTYKKPRPKRAILYLHGGGYCIGSPYSYRVMTGALAKSSGIAVYAPDYRLAPENPHPAALDDALAAWHGLVAQGFMPRSIAVVGDSAGGGLAVSMCLALRNSRERLPGALALISPWIDLAGTGEAFVARAQRDPMLSPDGLRRWAREYLGELAPDHPACSPLYAELGGLPPTLIHVGTEEVLHTDSIRLAAHARRAGVDVRLREFEGLWHDFHLHVGLLRESGVAIRDIAEFIQQHLGAGHGDTGAHAAMGTTNAA
jgi:monoterpene epsilon-lactone hydrolase